MSAVDVARLGPMDELDAGAFGTVYRLSTYTLPGFADLAYKEFTNTPSDAEIANLTALVAFRSGADATTRAILDDAAAWPLQLVTRHGAVCGFVMQLIPPEFFGQQILPSGRTVHLPVKSQWLVVDPAKADAAGITVPREDDIPARLVLCAKLAHVLGVLHRAGFVYGDLSLNNVVFSAASPPRIMLVDCDAVQAPGSAPVAQAHTPDWTPPECVAGSRIQDTATDCYKLALFVMRVLTPGPHASQARDPVRVVGVLDLDGNAATRDGLSADRSRRPSAKRWYVYLTRFLGVLTSPPVIVSATVDVNAAMAGAMVTVEWRASGADSVDITASDGHRISCEASSGTGQCRIAVTRSGPFTVSAANRFGVTLADTSPVLVLEPPTIARIDVPPVVLPQLPVQMMTAGRELADLVAGLHPELPGRPWDAVVAPDLASALAMELPPVPDLREEMASLAAGLTGDSELVDDLRAASSAATVTARRGIGTAP